MKGLDKSWNQMIVKLAHHVQLRCWFVA